jgi:phosphoesterase RecJ-like protein
MLKGLGKDVTAIWGDSGMTSQFLFLPGSKDLLEKNYFEINISEYDLFIILDSASIDRVSAKAKIEFPSSLKTIVIDHHISNTCFGNINLVPDNAPATAAILYELFLLWKIEISKEVAICLMIGLFTDTGGFRFRGVTPRTFETMSHLTTIEPRYPEFIAEFENDAEYERVVFMGLAYNSIEMFFNKKVAMAVVSYEMLNEKGLSDKHTQKQSVANVLKSIKGVVIGIECTEVDPSKVKFSFRSRDPERYDVSELAVSLGGGGHKVAAGVLVSLPIEEAKKKLVSKIEELYPDLA